MERSVEPPRLPAPGAALEVLEVSAAEDGWTMFIVRDEYGNVFQLLLAAALRPIYQI